MNDTQNERLRIATRASALARWQANWVGAELKRLGHQVELVFIETQGDRELRPFAQLEGQGFFTKAVQDALLSGQADLAVHSYKDLPSTQHPELAIAALPRRADVRDVLLTLPHRYAPKNGVLPVARGASVGSSAARRRAQLLALRPDLQPLDLRGNVETRVGKLRDGKYDAILLAAAGLQRLELDLTDLQVTPLEPTTFLPAPAQGALALECRADREELRRVLAQLDDATTSRTVAAERGLMARLDGGCQLALGAHATTDGPRIALTAWYEGRVVCVQHESVVGVVEAAFTALNFDEAPA